MEEIAEGVLRIPLGFVNAYLVVTDDGLVLVDTGLPRTQARLVEALVEAQRRAGPVRVALLTHWHTDHMGGVAGLHRATGARVVAHELDAPIIDGSIPERRTLMMRLAAPFTGSPERTTVDEVLSVDGPFSLPGFTAVHTPGHTAGHVSFLLDRGPGVLLAGDAAASSRGRVRLSPGPVTEDKAAAVRSVAKLAALDFEIAVFGHGAPVVGGAVERFRELAASSRG